jgi:hypothetical protein
MNNTNIAIANIDIRQDDQGRFCINDLHRASGGEDRHSPRRWIQLQATQDLVDELEIDGIPSIFSKQGVGTFACLELVYDYAAWISPKFKVEVYRTFHAVTTGKTPQVETKQDLALPELFTAGAQAFKFYKLLGLDKNASALAANNAVLTTTGVNLLAIGKQTHLISESQEHWFTPTELGKEIGMSAVKFNRELRDAGLQVRVGDTWQPTEQASGLFRVFDTGKANGIGLPVTQVKWSRKVIEEVEL